MSPHDPNDAFDAQVRAVHAASLEQLSPRVQAQLAQRRRLALQGTPRRSRGLLPWAGAATAGLALALVVQLRPPSAPAPSKGTARSAAIASRTSPLPASQPRLAAIDAADRRGGDAEAIAPDLSEDPDFYLWLGDASPARAE